MPGSDVRVEIGPPCTRSDLSVGDRPLCRARPPCPGQTPVSRPDLRVGAGPPVGSDLHAGVRPPCWGQTSLRGRTPCGDRPMCKVGPPCRGRISGGVRPPVGTDLYAGVRPLCAGCVGVRLPRKGQTPVSGSDLSGAGPPYGVRPPCGGGPPCPGRTSMPESDLRVGAGSLRSRTSVSGTDP
jgi:hypothetical protein